jgi:hypothetical protein
MDLVLVGVFEPKDESEREMLEERVSLIAKLESHKVPFLAVDSIWPRDDFVFFNNKLLSRKIYGHYADGGYVRSYPQFTVACAGVSEDENSGKTDSTDDRLRKLRKLYGKNIQIIPDPNYTLNDELRPHSDMVIFPIPDKRLVYVDAIYYKENNDAIDNFSKRFNLGVRTVFNNYGVPSWPCNTLSIKDENRTINITNIVGNGDFIHQLEELGNKVISLPFMANCKRGGSVNCATNTIPRDKAYLLKEIYD